MTVHADSDADANTDIVLDSLPTTPRRIAPPQVAPHTPRVPAEGVEPGEGASSPPLVRQCLAQLRAAAARRSEDSFALRARQLIALCDHLQAQREVLMQAGWLAGYAPWDQRLDIDAGLQAVRALAQAPSQDWGEAALVTPRPPQALPGDETVWVAPVQSRGEGVEVLVLGLHRPAAHLLLGFARAWLTGRACLALSPESHPVLEALLPLMRSGLPHLGAMLRWQVSDGGWAASEVPPLLEGADHVQVWRARPAGEPHPQAPLQSPLQGLAAQMRAPVAAGLAVLGEDVEVRVVSGANRVLWLDGALVIAARADADLEALARRGLQRKALEHFALRLGHYAQQMGRMPPALRLSSARTRWGSCSTKSGIRLNWRLVHFALPTIDYVVTHELAHLREMNHSPRFWDVVRSVLPDYERMRGQLKDDVLPAFE